MRCKGTDVSDLEWNDIPGRVCLYFGGVALGLAKYSNLLLC